VRALTVRQPWAWAIAHAHKDIENRTRNIIGGYHGTVAIHAALAWSADGASDKNILAAFQKYRWLHEEPTHPIDPAMYQERFTPGAVIATAEILGAHRHEPGCCESPWAMPGQWHINLGCPIAIPEPVPCRGALGLWRLDNTAWAAVVRQIQTAAPF
jgi:hypothetical protein